MDKIKSISIICITIMVLCVFLIPQIIKDKAPISSDIEKQIKRENDSLKLVNEGLMNQFVKDSLVIDSISKNVSEGKAKVVYLNNNKNEKIRIIGGYNNDELYRFFSSVNAEDIR